MIDVSARAPGKVILSGEHAVLYGAPALAMAVDRHTRVGASPSADGAWRVRLGGFGDEALGRDAFLALAGVIEARREAYLAGQLPVNQILRHPAELVLYALSALVRDAGLPAHDGYDLEVTSTLPLGGGMGSSAAIILAALAALGPVLGADLPRERLYDLALRAEHVQHGKSSGLDPYVCLYGGLVRFLHGEATRLDVPAGWHLSLVFTGKPESSTGECVDAVRRQWARHGIWTDFAGVCESFEKSLLARNLTGLKAAIRHNHRLLNTLGVVPAPVARFVREVEARGGAAKICGAGAVRGPSGGIVLVFPEDGVEELAAAAGYTVMRVGVDARGVRND